MKIIYSIHVGCICSAHFDEAAYKESSVKRVDATTFRLTTPKKQTLKLDAVLTQNFNSSATSDVQEDVQVASSAIVNSMYYYYNNNYYYNYNIYGFCFKYKFPIKLTQYINNLFILSGLDKSEIMPDAMSAAINIIPNRGFDFKTFIITFR